MSGRIEKEDKLREKINEKLTDLPYIFTKFYHYMDGEGKSYGTIKHYIEYVSDFYMYVTQGKVDEEFYKNIEVSDIRDYIASLRRREDGKKEIKNGDSIQCTRWSGLNTFFNFLVLDDYINNSPMIKTKRPKMRTEHKVVYLTEDEINGIMKKIEKDPHKKMINRDKALVSLGISTGLRVAALTQIDISDIDFEHKFINVYEKGNKERKISFGDNMKNILAAWLLDRNMYYPDVNTDALFLSQWGRRITEEGVRQLLRKYTGGIDKHITPHKMRSTCATTLASKGVNIQTIASILGHEQITTTQKYVDVLNRDREEATNILDNLI